MPMPDTDTTSPKFLRDKYAIVGVGETTYTRGSGVTTRKLGTWAVRNAIEDAGLKPSDVDGVLSYQSGDSTFGTFIAGDLGIRPNFYMDVFGGGSSTEALVGMAFPLSALASAYAGKTMTDTRHEQSCGCAARQHAPSLRPWNSTMTPTWRNFSHRGTHTTSMARWR